MRFSTVLAMLAASLLPLIAHAAERTIVVLDASGSMWGQIDGKAKMEIARETLDKVLPSVAGETELGLMVYGHRDKGSCSDIELMVAPAPGTAAQIADVVSRINPKGKTPISQAVREAAEALKYTEEKANVVLVTDGLETCEADPCALAAELESKGVDFTAHVVGFGLTPEEGKQVACLAEGTGGQYFQASDAGQLVAALAATVAAPPVVKEPPQKLEPEPVKLENNVMPDSVISEGGPSLGEINDVQWRIYKAAESGEPDGDYIDLQYKGAYAANYPAGRYVALVTLNSSIERKVSFEVKDNEIARPFVNFNAAHVTILAKRTADDKEPDSNAAVLIAFGDYSTNYYGTAQFYAPAGELRLTGTIGPTVVEDKIQLTAGESIQRDLIIGSGVIDNKAVYAAGGLAVDSTEVFFEIVSPQKDINGERKSFGYAYGSGTKLDTPVGDFVLTAKLGSALGETAYSIKAGERKDVIVDINAGVLAVAAPGAYSVEILKAKVDIQGNRESVSTGFGADYKDTVPPGDYIVRVAYEGDKAPKETPATVKAGERSEITVE